MKVEDSLSVADAFIVIHVPQQAKIVEQDLVKLLVITEFTSIFAVIAS